MIVFLERGAAAGSVGNDGVEVFAKKYGEIFSRDFAAVGGKDADGGFVELRKSDVGDAAGEEGDAGAARTGGGKRPAEAAEEKMVVDARQETFALGETEKFQDADAARDGLQAGALIETQNACGVNDAVRIGEQVPENEVARDASEPGAGIVALDARAGVLDEFSIFDPGGAGGFAGAAVETFVDVVDEGIRDGLLVQFDMNHLMDAAARRIGFEVPQAIGGAGIEAEAAMDTASIVLVDRSLAGDGGREHGLGCSEGRMIRLCRLDRKNCWCEGEVGGSEQEQGSRTPKGSAWEIIRELRGGCSRSRRNVCRR